MSDIKDHSLSLVIEGLWLRGFNKDARLLEKVDVQLAALREENERLKEGTAHHMNISQVLADGNANMYEMVMERDAEIELLKARVAELEGMYKPVYCVNTGRVDVYMNELYIHTDKPVPMADNFVLYYKEPANEG